MDLLITILLATAVQLLLFLYLRGRIQQQLNATDLLKDVQTEIDSMVRELNLSAERNVGVLEARISEMEELLGRADQKVILLTRELERRDRANEVYSQLKKPVADVQPEPAAVPVFVSEMPVLAAEPTLVPEIVPEPIEAAEPRTLRQRVVDLRLDGKSPSEIASITGATQGEVELILSLFQGSA